MSAIDKINEFLAVFQERPKDVSESAEGNLKKINEFLAVFWLLQAFNGDQSVQSFMVHRSMSHWWPWPSLASRANLLPAVAITLYFTWQYPVCMLESDIDLWVVCSFLSG